MFCLQKDENTSRGADFFFETEENEKLLMFAGFYYRKQLITFQVLWLYKKN